MNKWIPKVGDWVILKGTYCDPRDGNGCTDDHPCPECLAMCNRFVIAGQHYGELFFNPSLCNRDGGNVLDQTCCSIIQTDESKRLFPFHRSEGRVYKLSEFMPVPESELPKSIHQANL